MDEIRTNRRHRRTARPACPDSLFVFGDNMGRHGRKGQAAACRDEPNAIGIPTKWLPSMEPSAFFSDADFPEVKPIIDQEFLKLAQYLRAGGTIVFPADGIGTGLADLPRRAPRIHAYIRRGMARLIEIAAAVNQTQQTPAQEAAPAATPPGGLPHPSLSIRRPGRR